jgi:hypothetical protein
MVDLAGSERVRKTQSSGQLLREASYINKSLTFLEQVAIAKLEGREHVPYRCEFSSPCAHACECCHSILCEPEEISWVIS